MEKTSDKVIRVAKNEIGYLEKRSNESLNSKTANAGSANYTKYGKWYGLTPAYWCAEFVSWCFNAAFGSCSLIYGKSASCEVIRQRFISKKRYHSDAKAGDLIFFKGSRHSGANHIGIVTKVSGSTIYTVEGNTSSDAGVVDNGGVHIVNLCGHEHDDMFGYTANGVLNMVVECATTWAVWTGGKRIKGTKTYDCFNVFSVEKDTGIFKVVRIGDNVDHYLRAKNILSYDYVNKRILYNA